MPPSWAQSTEIMASLPDLHPIKIPPLEVKIGRQIFTCAGNGLMKDSQGYTSDLQPYLPRTEPILTKAGKIAKRQPVPQTRPLAFWKAQCAFRNFVQTGSIKVLQSRLAGPDPKMDGELAKEQLRANKEFRTLNHEARESGWLALSTNEDKATFDLERFLHEVFPGQNFKPCNAKENAIILKISERWRIHEAAGPLGLFTESADAPFNADGSAPTLDRWIVIGTSRIAVGDKLLEIASLRQAAPKPRPKQTARKFVGSIKWPAYPSNRGPQSLPSSMIASASSAKEGPAGSEAKGSWDVTGEWQIYCQVIEEEWPNDCQTGLSMTILQSQIGQKYQLWAVFHFGVISGIFRFMEPKRQANVSDHKPKDEPASRVKVKSTAVHPSCFKITSLPSPSHPVAPFRWRGEESGEFVIQLHSDEYPCTLTFSGPGGGKCNGTFLCDFAKTARFSGFKVSDLRRPHPKTPQMEWKERSAGAYERARVSRWGGGRGGWHHFESSDDEEEDEEDSGGNGTSENSAADEDEEDEDDGIE